MPIDYGSNNVATSGNLVASSGNFTSALTVNNVSVATGVSVSITNATDNRVLTSTNTGGGINAETNATFDGTTLAVSGAISVDNLKLDGNTLSSTNSNGNIIISPSGTGALQRDSGGDARGQYSVDWQTVRSSVTMVAAANYGVIGGGENNTMISTSNHSTIGGGYSNSVSGAGSQYGTIGGGRGNNVSGTNSYYSTIGGGGGNGVSGDNSYYSTIGGGSSNSVSGDYSQYSTIGGGYYNSVSGTSSNYSTIGGGNSNSVSGTYSFYSTIGGGRNNSVSGTNSFYSTIGGGYSNSVSGNNSQYSSIGGGRSNSVSGANSQYSTIGGGRYNTVSGTSSAYSTIPGGLRAAATRYGELCHAAGRFDNNGDAQHSIFVLRGKTTNASQTTTLGLDGSTTSRLTIASGAILSGTINIVGSISTGANVARYLRQFSIKNVGGTTSLVGSIITLGTDEVAGTSISITADDTNDAISISVTRSASETWRWVATVDAIQMNYGT
jgi:hypothetical protein